MCKISEDSDLIRCGTDFDTVHPDFAGADVQADAKAVKYHLIMKRFIFLLMLMSVWVSGSARNQNKETLKERIERWKNDMAEFNAFRNKDAGEEALIDTLTWFQAMQAIEDSSFVIEADAVTFKHGTRIQVNSTTNFISMDGDRAVIQISPSYIHSGPNGVGGITVEGTVSNVEKTFDKKGRMHFSMYVTGRGVNATVYLTAVPGTNRVTATVSPTFHSNDIRLDGYLVPHAHSRVYEGMSL